MHIVIMNVYGWGQLADDSVSILWPFIFARDAALSFTLSFSFMYDTHAHTHVFPSIFLFFSLCVLLTHKARAWMKLGLRGLEGVGHFVIPSWDCSQAFPWAILLPLTWMVLQSIISILIVKDFCIPHKKWLGLYMNEAYKNAKERSNTFEVVWSYLFLCLFWLLSHT